MRIEIQLEAWRNDQATPIRTFTLDGKDATDLLDTIDAGNLPPAPEEPALHDCGQTKEPAMTMVCLTDAMAPKRWDGPFTISIDPDDYRDYLRHRDDTARGLMKAITGYITAYWQDAAAGHPYHAADHPGATARDMASDYMTERYEDWLADMAWGQPGRFDRIAAQGHGDTPMQAAIDACERMFEHLWPHTTGDDPDRP